jgi:hypothetical protein
MNVVKNFIDPLTARLVFTSAAPYDHTPRHEFAPNCTGMPDAFLCLRLHKCGHGLRYGLYLVSISSTAI